MTPGSVSTECLIQAGPRTRTTGGRTYRESRLAKPEVRSVETTQHRPQPAHLIAGEKGGQPSGGQLLASRNALPKNLDAQRVYAEGLRQLRQLNANITPRAAQAVNPPVWIAKCYDWTEPLEDCGDCFRNTQAR
jgi:hypothetical protein